MGKHWWVIGVALAGFGCLAPSQERVHDYSEDGISLFRQGNYAAARESFQAALTIKGPDTGLLFNLGECNDRLGNIPQAEKFYRECLARDSNNPACRHSLVVLLVKENRRPEADQMVQEWLAKEPKLAAPYAEDGWLLEQSGDLPRAQARLQQALEIDPHSGRALTELAVVYEAMQRPDRALVLYERVLDQEPNQIEISKRINFLLAKGIKRPHPD